MTRRLDSSMQSEVSDMDRTRRDEHALVLFSRMLSRQPVWVASPAKQMAWIQSVGLDDQGEVIAWDHDGHHRRAEDYLLDGPDDSQLTESQRVPLIVADYIESTPHLVK